MGRIKKEILEPLKDYEEDGIWMSYRYCIGRHTIASHMRAGDILKHYYKRLKLTPERCKFMSKDINKSIEDCLRWGQLNVYMSYSQYDNINPLDETLNAISDEDGVIDGENIKHISKINIEFFDGKVLSRISNDVDKTLFYPLNDLKDLIVWSNCAKILDIDSHKVCKVSYQGKDEYIEYVEMTSIDNIDDGNYKVIKRKVPVDKYVANSAIYSYINEDYIVEDNLPLNILKQND